MAKICLITSSVFTHGGEQRVTAVIANELMKNNQVIVYTMDTEEDRKKNPYELNDKIEIRYTKQPQFGIVNRVVRRLIRDINEKTTFMYKRNMFYKLLEYAYFQKKWQNQMVEELTREKYDVIVAVSGGNSLRLGLIADRLDCKTVGWEHNAYEAYFETPGYYFWHMDQLFGESARRLDNCVVLNEYISGKYKQAFDVECDVIYNPRSFVSMEKSRLENKTFVACGRFIKQKGFDLLVESFAEFAKKDDEWKLVLVGDGEMREQLERTIQNYQLNNRVEITGYTNNVKQYLKDASVYVLSSRWEGFPMVLTEAFEMGLPVVAYDITAVAPLIEEGVQGFLAEAFDTHMFAERMLTIATMDKTKLQDMANEAIDKAETLAIEKIILQWKQLLQAD